MYHRIADIPGDRNSLPVEKFIEQLEYLHHNGYQTVTMNDVYMHYTKQKKLPTKSVLLTFDDGYKDNYITALPLLKKYKMSAVVFPISNWIGRENQWEDFHKAATLTMTLDELKSWQKNGMEIASHTVNPVSYTHLDVYKRQPLYSFQLMFSLLPKQSFLHLR